MRGGEFNAGSVDSLLRLGSGFRWRTPAQTLEIAERLMPALGISRVTDITRMDCLGLPVFASIRPRGQSLRVHAGKGVQPLDARVGALMEAIECAAAEPDRSPGAMQPLSVAELVAQFGHGIQWLDFAPILGVKTTPNQIVLAVRCEDISSGRPVLLPAELVFVPCEPAGMQPVFGWSSNGLASGNSLDEATLHGLLEVLERDALAMNKPRDASQWIGSKELPPHFRKLASDWHGMGVELAVRHVPNAFALPCFEACLHEPGSANVNLAAGSGLHLDRDIALSRAICEAAQSRLSHIHGGRDDITNFYSKFAERDASARAEFERGLVARMFNRSRRSSYRDLAHAHYETASSATVLGDLLRRLSATGFDAVFRYRFSAELDGLHVVKVIVPKCEFIESGAQRMGPRLLARVIGHA